MKWKEENPAEFVNVKVILPKANILYPFDPDADIIILTSAYQDGVSAVICNKMNGELRTVSCASVT